MRNLLIILFFYAFQSSLAQNIQLSPHAEISVITCGPSQEELYSAFGHSAFRVYDPAHGIDEVYNYGVFDYNQPYFYLNFARGYLNYQLGVHDYQLFKNYYISHNRYIHEQLLNVTEIQKQKVYDFLQWNSLPENEHYRYDYFYDNCATKLRDVIAKVLVADSVKFDGSYITTDYTIRDLTDIYLHYQPWGDLGIDICLGLPMDKKASPYEYMFLPDYIESGFAHASIQQNEVRVPLVKETFKVYESREEGLPDGLPHPLIVFGVIAVLIIAISGWDIKRKKISTWLDVVLFGTTGAIGLLLFLLWFFTDHKAAANNFNILWALPTHLIAVVAFIKNPQWLKKYFLVAGGIQILILLGWWIMPQQLNYALIPLVLALLTRAWVQFRLRSLVM